MHRRKHALECSCWDKYPNEYRKDICLIYYHPCYRPRARKTHCIIDVKYIEEVNQDET